MSHSHLPRPRARARVGGVLFALCLAFVVGPQRSVAAESEVADVKLSSNCASGVGGDLAYLVREEIRKSAGYRLVQAQSGLLYELRLSCLPDDKDANAIARFSYLLSMYGRDWPFPYALEHGIQTCGKSVVDECARSIVASMDSTISDTRAGLLRWIERQKPTE